ncbi:MAG: HAMP domain-containing histidine kinase [Blautia sp.]|nr:HAMP domain-containing histidine kinase [Blautia sp.]
MRQLKGNIWVKIIAMALTVVTGGGAFFCLAAAFLFGSAPELQGTKEEIERVLDEELLITYGAALMEGLDLTDESDVQNLDALEDGNIRYTLVQSTVDADGEVKETVLYTNDATVDADNCITSVDFEKKMHYRYNCSSFWNALLGTGRTYSYYWETGEDGEEAPAPRYMVYLSVGSLWSGIDADAVRLANGQTLRNGMPDYTFGAARLAAWAYSFRRTCGVWLAVSVLVFFVCFVFLMSAAGRRVEDTELHLRWPDKIPFGIYLTAVGFAVTLAWCGIIWFIEVWGGYYGGSISVGLAVGGALTFAVLAAVLVLLFCMSVAVRIKTKTFWHSTVLYYLLRPLAWAFRAVRSNVPLFVKGLVVLGTVSFAQLIVILMGAYDEEFLVGMFFLYKLVEIPLFICVLYQMSLLKKGGMRIAAGDYSQPIDTHRMLWEFKKHAENINHVGDGISLAVAERMKSERFKTELITNVSHDIKTPLTSIINYVDLMKKEEITDEKLLEYMAVLDRQSARLKKLIEDLMEASKASTGNLPVNLELCDATVMLSQVVGEFEERAGANELELVVTAPEPPVYIMADGRYLWRIIDNLMGNICKYAMPKTRVYIDLEVYHGMVIMTFRNISKCRLNISSAELMERFVRGDSSRNTEGSGLGLSIAQSLAGLMDGNMAVQIDGDLFKAIVSFAQVEK